MIFGSSPRIVLLRAIAILIAITIHEYAHAWAADRLGDPTPRLRGRLSLNPLVHLDLLGTLLLLIAGFGWAKPVEINPRYFPDYRKSVVVVASAGPLSNFVLAFLVGLVFRLDLIGESLPWLAALAYVVVVMNISLAVFNLIPVHPLDGSKILSGLLPPRQALAYDRVAPYGPLVLLALIMLPGSIIGGLLGGPVSWLVAQALGGPR